MIGSTAILDEAFGRIPDAVRRATLDLDEGQLAFRPPGRGGSAGNSIGWLIWHLTRVQDNHISEASGLPELWTGGGWAERFNLDLDAADTGYGHTTAQVDAVQPGSRQLLVDYYDAVHARTIDFVVSLGETDLDGIIDDSWDPPVTLRVRLVSVVEDCLQHAGQAAYVRGLLR